MPNHNEGYHYWIICKDPDSQKPYLVYGCPARDGEETARQKGLEMLNGIDFKLMRYRTRDVNKASSLYRGKRLETTHSLKEASKRIGHSKSLKRLKHQDRFKNTIW